MEQKNVQILQVLCILYTILYSFFTFILLPIALSTLHARGEIWKEETEILAKNKE